ncbi:hypothetical protein [Actinoplanes sp. NPDC049118]|uniref:hypothetical protein n=1 Tax=Actinoplanes sp. NPDC049118 TaxID=3155769 RepID=UPI0033D9567C
MDKRNRIATAVTAALATVSATVVLSASPAHAEGVGLAYNKKTCGITTCTAYWSVDRTAEIHAEWKDTLSAAPGAALGVVGAGTTIAIVMAQAGSALAAAAAQVAAGAVVVGAVLGVEATVFNHMINGAEHDGRCLIFKYPKGHPELGWFGSVSLNNPNCDQGPV